MITPRFHLSQDDDFITIIIQAPFCSLEELDVDIQGEVFLFFCRPYYLRLTLPGYIVDDHRSQSQYNCHLGDFSFTYPKKHPKEHFRDLHLITKLLSPKAEGGSSPIEVLPESQDQSKKSEDWQYSFGFPLKVYTDFKRVIFEFDEIFMVDPYKVPLPERGKAKIQYEQGKFDIEHYIGDLLENAEILSIIQQDCLYQKSKAAEDFKYTDQELDTLKEISKIGFEVNPQDLIFCYNGIIDILFAFCYDQRITNFEGCIQSDWNIYTLASTLSWLDVFYDPKDVIISVFRRIMIYPLFRSFELAQTVFDDLKALLQLGEHHIIRSLIHIHRIFQLGDGNGYILNNIFIKGYISYIGKWDSCQWTSIVKKVLDINVTKEELGLKLPELEDIFAPTYSPDNSCLDLNLKDNSHSNLIENSSSTSGEKSGGNNSDKSVSTSSNNSISNKDESFNFFKTMASLKIVEGVSDSDDSDGSSYEDSSEDSSSSEYSSDSSIISTEFTPAK